jgi:hypothetical protein
MVRGFTQDMEEGKRKSINRFRAENLEMIEKKIA